MNTHELDPKGEDMETLRFKQMPLVVKIAVGLSLTMRGGQSRNL